MFLGYNTNGFAHHRLEDALAIMADLGYQGVALTVDHHVLSPFDKDWLREADKIRKILDRLGLRVVIETGARFLLDPRRKHQPTLVSPTPEERQKRLRFLESCVELANLLGADAVSFWSGTPSDGASEEILWQRLTQECHALISTAQIYGVRLAFEPEPGMFIDTMASFGQLCHHLGVSPTAPQSFGLTLDVGHLHCQGETPIADEIRRWRHLLWNVHIEDMRQGTHDHLMFGEGEMSFPPILAALREIRYEGGVYVELSRHGHDAVRVAQESFAFLRANGG